MVLLVVAHLVVTGAREGLGVGGRVRALDAFDLDEESSFGTAVGSTRHVPIVSESLALTKNMVQSNAMFPGYHTRASARRVEASRSAGGDFKLEATTRGIGLLLKYIMGAAQTITPTTLTTGVYEYVIPLGLGLGKSLTIQKQFYDMGGTIVQAFDYPGSKIPKAGFALGQDGALEITASVDARDEVKQASPTAASYGSYKPFRFRDAKIKKNGGQLSQSVIVRGMSIDIERPMDADRRGIGGGGLKGEQTENDFPAISGNMEGEFADPAHWYDDYANDTAFALALLFEGATIASTYKETLEFTMPAAKLDGESPKAGGPGTVTTALPFTVGWDGTNPDMTVRYVTADASL